MCSRELFYFTFWNYLKLFMPKITMSASVHSPFLSFYDALIAVCCTAYGDALLVRLPAILAILDDVALAVCNVYSKSVIHGNLSLEMVSAFVLQELSQSACTCICLHTYPLAFSHRRKRWDSSKTAGSHRCSRDKWIAFHSYIFTLMIFLLLHYISKSLP